MKIILIGGSGMLGTELLKLNANIIAPSRDQCNIENYSAVLSCITEVKPDLIIHAAAETDNRRVEKNAGSAILTNIVGTAYIAEICLHANIRMVYISTDYIYQGDRGNYKESDTIQPFNLYAWSKLGGECSVKAVPNHLIIRTSFGANEFPYKEAFSDKWTSKDYVDQIAPLIYEASLSPLTGVLNLGTSRKTLYNHASERSEVNPVKISETNYNTPYDTSLNLQKWMDYKGSKSIAKPHIECRVCGSKNMLKYLDLGLMPLANNLEFTAQSAKDKERSPLQVMFCQDCSLSQLSVVVDPVKMFSHYVYRSSVNKPYLDHCNEMSSMLMERYNFGKDTFHIDIAGNDGTLLKEFKIHWWHQVLNVDPAENLTAIAEANGIPSIADFWGLDVATRIVNEYSRADLITATNVFAHLDNVKEFIVAARMALTDEGVLVIENPYLIDFIENMEFDTVYHEHVTYWSVIPMCNLLSKFGMRLIHCEKQAIHGGTMRYIIAKDESDHILDKSVGHYYAEEMNKGYHQFSAYSDWAFDVKKIITGFGSELLQLKKQGYRIAAFAASAKGNTLLNCSGMNTDIIDFIADDTSEKIGKFSPGNGIPIVNAQRIMKTNPDYIVILSWNFTSAIIERVRSLGYKGKFIIPIPEFKIV